ncbi:CLUMA_CG020480, isoform A [Clunio marinus]|uniref:hydroxymethylbilane synthase n=1 Tax=Clunio marinus TaxID=568069 RepID=A0A1J1J529_9DIPT|nr:CLUMA_CG020480, isoform A [Clunio marinus]
MSSKEDNRKVIKVGSRKSELALIQTKYVISCLQKLFPTLKWEIHTMTTVGDRVLNKSLPKIGEKSLFTKDLEEALATGGVDFVVHSLKDLPTQLPCGMTIGAVLEREDPRDALVLNKKYEGHKLSTLPEGSLIGTSSLRRSAQLSRKYPHLKVCDIRGNLNTRLAKLDAPQSKFSGIVLANAGLVRMGWVNRVDQIIEPYELLYAVGQGALAVECRVNDTFILNVLSKLCDVETQCRILTERSFLKTLGGGCSAPVGINSNVNKNSNSHDNEVTLNVDGAVWSLNGKTEIVDKISLDFILNNDKKRIVNDETNEASPPKRMKINEYDNENLKKSPEVIDDSGSSNAGKNASELVNIHGKVFDVCPYSGLSKNDLKDNDNEESSKGCPIKFDHITMPIGQDFMGECPVLNTEQKITFDSSSKEGGDTLGCPIGGKSIPTSSVTTEDIKKCPFLHQQNETVELIDYEANLDKTECKSKSLVENIGETTLYCGFFCHDEILRPTFDKCEELGRKLAQKLISAGALEVMKVAQDEIHSKC